MSKRQKIDGVRFPLEISEFRVYPFDGHQTAGSGSQSAYVAVKVDRANGHAVVMGFVGADTLPEATQTVCLPRFDKWPFAWLRFRRDVSRALNYCALNLRLAVYKRR